LPADFKTLLLWKNGQRSDALDIFHSLTNEMFASSQSMMQTMRDKKELVRFGDISAESWSNTWAPCMDNGGGNYSCLDLTTGEVVFRDHETQEIVATYSSLKEWLAALFQELRTNNFGAWDFKECRTV
jgi:cell wall assembly regulator SMI1